MSRKDENDNGADRRKFLKLVGVATLVCRGCRECGASFPGALETFRQPLVVDRLLRGSIPQL